MILLLMNLGSAPGASPVGAAAANDYLRRIQPITQRRKRNLKRAKK